MTVLSISGGTPLHGQVTLSGSKHSSLAVLGTVLLMKGKAVLHNFPRISDTHHMLRIIESLGVKVADHGSTILLEVGNLSFSEEELWRVGKLRSSVLFLGSILARLGAVSLPKPGGDKLGNRPMDEFLYVLDAFGIHHEVKDDVLYAELTAPLHRHYDINLISETFPEMGNNRTVLALILAWANRGRTTLKNALILPEIIETCYFLEEISGGYVTIDGVGTDTLVINSPGMDAIHSDVADAIHMVGPDKCEYAFWIAAASLTRGDITIHYPVSSRDFRNTMRWLRAKWLRPAEIPLDVLGYGTYRIRCSSVNRTKAFHLESTAHELHGIAFDAAPVFASILLNAEGTGSFYCFKYKHERAKWIQGLEQLGVRYGIQQSGKLIIEGIEQLCAPTPLHLEGGDIRGASCVLLASLAAAGEPISFTGIEHLERGMENPVGKLTALGASLSFVT